MKKNLILFILILVAGLYGCGSETEPVNLTQEIEVTSDGNEAADKDDINNTNDTKGTEDTEAVEEAGTIYAAMNQFAFSIYDQMDKEQNILISPYSIYTVLALIDNAAGGTTKEELDQLLKISNNEDTNQALKLLRNSFSDPDASLETANSIWISKELELAETADDFLQTAANSYDAEVFQADFRDTDTIKEINMWVSDKTDKMIDPFLSELSEDTKLTLINAVYFYGEWAQSFKSEDTSEDVFQGLSGDETISMMNLYKKSFAYAEWENLEGIRLPYGEGSVVMDLWMTSDPEDSKNTDWISTIEENYDELEALLDQAQPEKIKRLAIPKFQMETPLIDLKEFFENLDAGTMFQSYAADFSIIANNLFVTDIVHKAKIIVDETGTKAAAATGLIMETTAIEAEEPTISFVADHPFFYTISDKATGTILFMGTMNDIE